MKMEQRDTETLAEERGHELILASRVKGTPVFNMKGARLGHVDDLSIEKKTGNVIYAIMSFGGFLGIGERYHPLPWSILHFDVEQGGFVVPMDQAALEGAPHYDRAELGALGGHHFQYHGDTIFSYYGIYGATPFW
jgi:sporulation protein YlmC with PRC-barrel domain